MNKNKKGDKMHRDFKPVFKFVKQSGVGKIIKEEEKALILQLPNGVEVSMWLDDRGEENEYNIHIKEDERLIDEKLAGKKIAQFYSEWTGSGGVRNYILFKHIVHMILVAAKGE